MRIGDFNIKDRINFFSQKNSEPKKDRAIEEEIKLISSRYNRVANLALLHMQLIAKAQPEKAQLTKPFGRATAGSIFESKKIEVYKDLETEEKKTSGTHEEEEDIVSSPYFLVSRDDENKQDTGYIGLEEGTDVSEDEEATEEVETSEDNYQATSNQSTEKNSYIDQYGAEVEKKGYGVLEYGAIEPDDSFEEVNKKEAEKFKDSIISGNRKEFQLGLIKKSGEDGIAGKVKNKSYNAVRTLGAGSFKETISSTTQVAGQVQKRAISLFKNISAENQELVVHQHLQNEKSKDKEGLTHVCVMKPIQVHNEIIGMSGQEYNGGDVEKQLKILRYLSSFK